MKCIHLRIRTKQYKKYMYCNNKKIEKEITFTNCKACKYKEYR